MEKCSKCSGYGKIKVQANLYCPRCFSVITIRRISKDLRETKKIQKNSNILVIEEITNHILKIIIKSFPINITLMSLESFDIKKIDSQIYENKKLNAFIKKNNIDTVVLPWTLDDELPETWNQIVKKNKNESNIKTIFVKLFLPILSTELAELARYYNIKLSTINKIKAKDKQDKIQQLFENLENRYLGSKFGFYKSIKELKELE